jgi:hypothetical protein
VICTGGAGLKLSREIITELATQGDEEAKKILDMGEKVWREVRTFIGKPMDEGSLWTLYRNRESQALVDLVKENRLQNIGGWTLRVVEVPVEKWAYTLEQVEDAYGSEYVQGLQVTYLPKE